MLFRSGPLTAGTVKDTTGTTGGNVRNIGNVVLAQSAAIPATAGTTTIGCLPAGSRILNIYINTTTVFNSATTLLIGDGTTTNKYLTTTTITTAALISADSGNLVSTAIDNVGATDVLIVATTSGSATTGAATIAVVYVQSNADGTETPTP